MADTLVFQAGPLTRAIEAIVAAGGSEPREAKLVADNLVTANLTGHDSHGVGAMPASAPTPVASACRCRAGRRSSSITPRARWPRESCVSRTTSARRCLQGA